MTEERTQYTVHPDVLVRLEASEQYIKHLESTNAGLTMVMGRHRETMREQAERIAELKATVLRQMENIARLDADNRRLRHLDAMPVDAMRRYVNYTEQDAAAFDAAQYIDDRNEIRAWLDGAA